ncbi:hypothetical protein KW782_00675 [Candidatus Parcubacteria bacterium]|nr:hypothetical protein [Candidatus Parcubacteria bacterium]
MRKIISNIAILCLPLGMMGYYLWHLINLEIINPKRYSNGQKYTSYRSEIFAELLAYSLIILAFIVGQYITKRFSNKIGYLNVMILSSVVYLGIFLSGFLLFEQYTSIDDLTLGLAGGVYFLVNLIFSHQTYKELSGKV